MLRSDQRRAAVWALYQSDLLERPVEAALGGEASAFTRSLAALARERQPILDRLIAEHAVGWRLERIAPLERSILRVALTEMLYADELPGERPISPEGAIDEAVELAKRFCGSEAPGFINGILGAVLRERRARAAAGG